MDAMIARLSFALPGPARRLATPGRIALLSEFIRFGLVGLVGFCVDTAIVYTMRGALGLVGAGVLSYLVAATVTWRLNRAWTFRGRGSAPAHRQWAMFLAANLTGFLLNRGTYAILVTNYALAAQQPILAIFAGMLAGMFFNFGLSRTLVFRN
jgi:putative flippase GtrA